MALGRSLREAFQASLHQAAGRRTRLRWRARPSHRRAGFMALVAVGLCALAGQSVVGDGTAGAQPYAPAFYTWQAPGGASTAGQRVIALTFDDGPGPYTPQVLSVLEQYHIPATFFEIGENIADYPQYTQMVADAGYPVEDHTWSHPDLVTLTAAEVDKQIDQTQTEIHSLIGQTPACVRPPYDAWDTTVLDQIGERGLTAMSYSIDPRDWSMPGVTAIVQGVVGAAFPGAVVDMHDGGGNRSETVAALPRIITELKSAGYQFVSICGYLPQHQDSVISPFGQAPAVGPSIVSNAPLVGAAPSGTSGLWLAATDGGVFSFDAPFYGSMGGDHLNKPIVGMAATPTGKGYWEVASDGGIFSFGAASFYGSMGGDHLNKPIVGMAATPTGKGYWEVASDGGIFSFGAAHFYGSTGAMVLNQPIVGMAADPATGGYWLVASDGGVFTFDAPFDGSMAGKATGTRYFAIVPSGGGTGYWLAGAVAAGT